MGNPLKKIPLIDIVRTFSILVVLALHLAQLSFLRKPSNAWSFWIWEHFWRNGTYGVNCFFVVSGYLISGVIAKNPGGFWKPSFRKFYVQRVGRILPLFGFTLLIGICMLTFPSIFLNDHFDVFRSNNGYVGAGYWFCILTFTFNWFLAFNPQINYGLHFLVLWSLSVEEQFYLLFPYALKKLKNTKNLFCFLIALIAIGFFWRLGCYFIQSNIYLQSCASPGVFDNIAAGILLYLAVDRWKFFLLKNKKISLILSVAGFGIMLGIYLGTSRDCAVDRVYASTALALGLFTFLLGSLHLSFFESKFWKPFGLPGKYCYGVYLLHPLVLSVMHPFIFRADAWIAFMIFAAVSTSLAAISYHFFEMPVNRFIRGITVV
jgi:peptidoglycan/LPS O-acetylase OafA/YrhL